MRELEREREMGRRGGGADRGGFDRGGDRGGERGGGQGFDRDRDARDRDRDQRSTRDWGVGGGGRDDFNDRRAREPERSDRSGREEHNRNDNRREDHGRDSRDFPREPARHAAARPSFSESDSSETEYTRKSRKWEITLDPHQQLEALDLWLLANPEVARDVDMLNNRGKGNGSKPPPHFQEGDWLCDGCGNHNWRSRMDCRGCGAPASAEKIAELQATKARAAVAQAARAPAPNVRPGDWMCVGCTTSNYASKKTCFRCNMSKPNEWVCSACNSLNEGVDKTTCGGCMGGGGGGAGHQHHSSYGAAPGGGGFGGGGAPPGGGYGGGM